MGARYESITENFRKFIQEQKIFFVGTAVNTGRVNISPKGMDSLRVLGENRVIWLNLTGSGNETSAHVQENPRMTVMFTAFEGKPLTLRLYGKAKVIHKKDPEWQEMYDHFNPTAGARQIFELNIDLVQASCGMSIPFYDYKKEREQLKDWAEKQEGAGKMEAYWETKNQFTIDGFTTHIMEKNM